MTLDTRFTAEKESEERKEQSRFKDHANFLLLKKT
jgi:hypothetical protein